MPTHTHTNYTHVCIRMGQNYGPRQRQSGGNGSTRGAAAAGGGHIQKPVGAAPEQPPRAVAEVIHWCAGAAYTGFAYTALI